MREQVAKLTESVVHALVRRQPAGGTFHIEDIQDQVELALMRAGGAQRGACLRALPRGAREGAREAQRAQARSRACRLVDVTENGVRAPLDMPRATALVRAACEGLGRRSSHPELILAETMQRDLYDGVPMDEVRKSLDSGGARADRAGPRLQLRHRAAAAALAAARNAGRGSDAGRTWACATPTTFPSSSRQGIEPNCSTSGSGSTILKCLGAALDANRDLKFAYLGLQILYDRYFLHVAGRRIELPQMFFMRVAMGLALNEQKASAKRARSSSTTCFELRFHELDADAVQFRHAALAARELLSDDGLGRP